MGIDYCRFRVTKRHVDLDTLIEKQALAFQSIWGWSSYAWSNTDETKYAIRKRLHLATYLENSKAIEACIEVPQLDEGDTDLEALPFEVARRASDLTSNPIFPPIWRVKAYRTMQSHELSDQVQSWQAWVQEIADGHHQSYLQWLHLHNTSDILRNHWSELRRTAISTLDKQVKWAQKAILNDVRTQIIHFAEPQVIPAPISPKGCNEDVNQEQYAAILAMAETLRELNKLWNYHAKKNYRVLGHYSYYARTLDTFRLHAMDENLCQFLNWTQRCADESWGLYLHY